MGRPAGASRPPKNVRADGRYLLMTRGWRPVSVNAMMQAALVLSAALTAEDDRESCWDREGLAPAPPSYSMIFL